MGWSSRARAASGYGAVVVVNCAGLGAGRVARLAGDESFDVYPRKGEFLVFDPPAGEPLERILLPVPAKRTKGVLVFPTVDGKVVAGPTAIDQEDPDDWSVRPEAREEILPEGRRDATRRSPAPSRSPPTRACGPPERGVNYLIARSRRLPGLVNVAAIRSTGLTASLAIAERVAELVADAGVDARRPRAARPPGRRRASSGPWWRRTARTSRRTR